MLLTLLNIAMCTIVQFIYIHRDTCNSYRHANLYERKYMLSEKKTEMTYSDSLVRVGYFIMSLDVIFMKVLHGLRK